MSMAVLKLELVVVAAVVASALFWIEQGHRIVTDAPAAVELAASNSVCPASENVPYGEPCILFMLGARASDSRRAHSAESVPSEEPVAAGATCPPNNENIPYSASCIRFMSGWFWRPHAP
jgi:hypothetical protein